MFGITRNYVMNAGVRGRIWNEYIIILEDLCILISVFLVSVSLTLKIVRCEINRHYTIISFI